VFTGIYLVLGLGLFVARRKALGNILRQSAGTVSEAFSTGEDQPRGAD
jgi:cation:H+ antiporter